MILEWFWHGDSHIPLISRTTFLVSFGVTLQYPHLSSTTELQCPMCIWKALIGFGRMNNVLRYTVTYSCVNSSNTPSFLNASWILEFYLSKSLKNPSHFRYSYLILFLKFILFIWLFSCIYFAPSHMYASLRSQMRTLGPSKLELLIPSHEKSYGCWGWYTGLSGRTNNFLNSGIIIPVLNYNFLGFKILL